MIIKSYKGVGNLKFNMPREDVRKYLGKFKSFLKTPFSKRETDYFENHDLLVYYKEGYLTEAFEFGDNAEVLFNDNDLFANSFEKNINYFTEIDPNIEIEGDSFISPKYGLAMSKSAESELCESILVFIEGYYDD